MFIFLFSLFCEHSVYIYILYIKVYCVVGMYVGDDNISALVMRNAVQEGLLSRGMTNNISIQYCLMEQTPSSARDLSNVRIYYYYYYYSIYQHVYMIYKYIRYWEEEWVGVIDICIKYIIFCTCTVYTVMGWNWISQPSC